MSAELWPQDRRFGSAALLAGGRSQRMGGVDKQEILVRGEGLGPRAARLLSEAFGEVIVVTARTELYPGRGIRCVGDLIAGRGPLGGIHAALSASSSEWLYVMACDMPRFSAEYAAFLRAKLESILDGPGDPPLAAVTRFGAHIEPFHAYYSRALIPRLEGLLGTMRPGGAEPSVRDLLAGLACVWVPEAEARRLSPDWSLFANINSPADLESLESVLAGSGPD
ncbi:MAG TPA: molybdenum cofactor guanylyltransferase [Rectinemataceae bacterium]|nr:molybdenum cofactor guanylyltransferase [Rectinemataceae bacterium]